MKKHLFAILSATAMAISQPLCAQNNSNVVATHDSNGHMMFVDSRDADVPAPAHLSVSSSTSEGSSRYSGLVYWSNKEHRWKPVPSICSSTFRAARQAAREVDHLVSVPKGTSNRALLASQPVVPGSTDLTQLSMPDTVEKAIDAA